MRKNAKPTCTNFDLPDATILLYENFYPPNESDILFKSLLENINWQQHQIKIFGKLIDQPRLTAFYGDAEKPYTYSGLTLNPSSWNKELNIIKADIEANSNAIFSSVLLNYYRDGRDSMGWHADDEKELGKNPIIASMSFGASRNFQLKHNYRKDLPKVNIELTHGSLLIMKGSTQHYWKHQIPKTTKQLDPRINLTFRQIK